MIRRGLVWTLDGKVGGGFRLMFLCTCLDPDFPYLARLGQAYQRSWQGALSDPDLSRSERRSDIQRR